MGNNSERSGWVVFGLIVYLIALYGVLIFFQVGLWWNGANPDTDGMIKLAVYDWRISFDTWLMLVVLTAGGLGSFIHAATSLADFVGNRSFVRSWGVWYFFRPLIGSVLALIFYLLLRGGLLGGSTANGGASAQALNPYGFVAISVLAGMFAKRASDKLGEIFDSLFRLQQGGGDAQRSDKLVPPAAPAIAKIDPSQVAVNSVPAPISVTGTGFTPDSVVRFDGASRDTVCASDTALTVTPTQDDLAAAKTINVTVFAPPPGGGGESAPVTLTVQ